MVLTFFPICQIKIIDLHNPTFSVLPIKSNHHVKKEKQNTKCRRMPPVIEFPPYFMKLLLLID